MLTPTGFKWHRNPGTSCCGGKQVYAEAIECLRYPERVFEHRYSCVDEDHAGSFRDENMHRKINWRVKRVVWWDSPEVHSRMLLQHLACVFSLRLLLCTKTSKERNHNTGALNVSAVMFLLGSNSFQRNDTGTSGFFCLFVLGFFVLTSKRLLL